MIAINAKIAIGEKTEADWVCPKPINEKDYAKFLKCWMCNLQVMAILALMAILAIY
jgi:hypothetical protein